MVPGDPGGHSISMQKLQSGGCVLCWSDKPFRKRDLVLLLVRGSFVLT